MLNVKWLIKVVSISEPSVL